LSADCEFISPRFRSRSEWPVRRAAPQNREVALKGGNGPEATADSLVSSLQMLHSAHFGSEEWTFILCCLTH
jgi:hypothetical protein